jgi:hypothetical protein
LAILKFHPRSASQIVTVAEILLNFRGRVERVPCDTCRPNSTATRRSANKHSMGGPPMPQNSVWTVYDPVLLVGDLLGCSRRLPCGHILICEIVWQSCLTCLSYKVLVRCLRAGVDVNATLIPHEFPSEGNCAALTPDSSCRIALVQVRRTRCIMAGHIAA